MRSRLRAAGAFLVTAGVLATALGAAATAGAGTSTGTATPPRPAPDVAPSGSGDVDPLPRALEGVWRDSGLPEARLVMAGTDVLAGQYLLLPESYWDATDCLPIFFDVWVAPVAEVPPLLRDEPVTGATGVSYYKGVGASFCGGEGGADDIEIAVDGDEATFCTANEYGSGCETLVREDAPEAIVGLSDRLQSLYRPDGSPSTGGASLPDEP